jgi:A/G-specific adenine glycosylase
LTQHEDFPRKFSTDINQVKLWNEEPVLHKLSHQNLFVRFWILEYDKELTNGYPQDHLQRLAVPVVIQKFMANFFSFAI